MERKYYEVEFSNDNIVDRSTTDAGDEYSICIIAEHYPSIEEATEFCKKDMEKFGYKYVVSITPLDYDEAHNFFDMENEDDFPVLK